MVHAYYILGTEVYKYIFTLFKMYCFPLEQRLNESASVLRYTYVAYLTAFAYVIISNDEMPLTYLLVYCYSENSGCALTANMLCLLCLCISSVC